MENESLPLISFVIICYQQKNYIAETLQGAFAQEYSPLEIVISDDGSTDGTWEIVQDAIEKYQAKGGKHKIVANHNPTNIGMFANGLKAHQMANGEFIVENDGDDYSLPTRTMRIAEEWLKTGKKAVGVCHAGQMMTLGGTLMNKYRQASVGNPYGCMSAWRRDIVLGFSPMVNELASCDVVYAIRSMMVGECIKIPDVLMHYRVGSGVSSVRFNQRKPSVRGCRGLLAALAQAKSDLETAKPELSSERYETVREYIENVETYQIDRMVLMTGTCFLKRLKAFKRVRNVPLYNPRCWIQLMYVLPETIGDICLNAASMVKYLVRMFTGVTHA